MKEKVLKTAKTMGFTICLLVFLYLFCCIFSFKHDDGIVTIQNFYDLPEDTVDVLLLGSSHMGVNVDCSLMWDLRGIAAYNCWGSIQQTWNTYYYLKECLKYQTPKLVVMDVYGAAFSGDYPGYDNIIKNTQGLRLSWDKIEDILVSAPEEYRSALLLGIPTFHYRYSEINSKDFQNFFWNKKTDIQFIDSTGATVQSFDIPDVSGITEAIPLAEKCETYLVKILELCKEREIPILLVASPYFLHAEEQARFNRVGQIAADYGVPFLNFNVTYRELGIDPHEDFRDLAHLGPSGIEKYDSYLADYICANYDLPDRRLDPDHIWNQAVETDNHCIYSLPSKFYGGGHSYLDTGVQLYQNPYATFTLMAEIDTECLSEDRVWLSCFAEGDDYRGILLRESDGNLYIILDESNRIEIAEYGEKLKIGIVKEGLKYKTYIDGKPYISKEVSPFEPLDHSLLLGCQLHPDGTHFRFSQTEVDHLEVYDVALTDGEIAAWNPAELPEPEGRQAQSVDSSAAFFLEERFLGNGFDKYLDTGISPCADPAASWTLLTRFAENCDMGATVYFSSFAEDISDYRGIMARRSAPGVLNLLYGKHSINVDVPENSDITLAIVKDEIAYSIYVNGERVVDADVTETHPWDGNLLLGCQETLDGDKMRFSGVTLYNFEFYNGVMPEEEILAWSPESRPAPPPKIPTPVDYTLEQSFLGDGESEYLDTGIQLYDVPEKNWTLEMTFRNNGAQTLATCFAEDPNSYRGLIVSQLDEKTLNLTLGQTAVQLELSPQPEHTLKIEKRKYSYTVWLDDAMAAQNVTSVSPEYDGSLVIGCAIDGKGNPFRFSSAKILSLSVTGTD